jgi:excisionase family DNA binding protein
MLLRGLRIEAGVTDHWLSVTTAARLLDIHPETARRWIKAGRLVAVRYPNGYFRVSANAVEKILTTTVDNHQQP